MVTICILVVCALVIDSIKKAEDRTLKEAGDITKLSLQEQGYIKGVSIASSASIYIVNFLLKNVIRRLTTSERHLSVT